MKDYHKLLTDFYLKYNPEKVSDIPFLLEKYNGKEEELLASLFEKYNVSSDVLIETDNTRKNTTKKSLIIGGAILVLILGALIFTFFKNSGFSGQSEQQRTDSLAAILVRIDSIRIADSLRVADSLKIAYSQHVPDSLISDDEMVDGSDGEGLDEEYSDQSNEQVYSIVEEMPSFPGGEAERNKFLARNIIYPQQAYENGIQGTVYISFVVNSTGDVINVKILRSIGGGCDEEAVRVVKMMPKWNPGKQDGTTVNVLFNMPIYFKLRG
jgi:TonB family protein